MKFNDTLREHFSGMQLSAPSGGITSNAEDMTQWLHYLLGYGPPELDHLAVSMTLIPELVETNVPYFIKPDDPETMQAHNYYSRGWFGGHYRGENITTTSLYVLNDNTDFLLFSLCEKQELLINTLYYS